MPLCNLQYIALTLRTSLVVFDQTSLVHADAGEV